MGQTLGNGGHLSMLQLCDTEGGLLHSLTTHAQQPTIPAAVEQLLEAYSDIFTQPTSLLPPQAEHDKKIPLVQGANLVNKRPYRYAKHKEDVIDRLVQEYLTSGIIQKSSSPYASLVVLVDKKDGSWRLCVDY